MNKLIYADELLSYIDRLSNSGLGKQKSLEYLTKYINKQVTENDVEKLKMKNIKEDILRIEHKCLDTIEYIVNMDDTESFKTLGYMCGVNEMANEIIKLINEETKQDVIKVWYNEKTKTSKIIYTRYWNI